MEQYHNLLKDILHNGEERNDRTGTGTISVFARQLRFDLTQGFPAVTTKKLAFKSLKAELLWFIEGSCDERRLAEILYGNRNQDKTTIWTGNAEADYWKPYALFPGDLGPVYGVQWRDWVTHTPINETDADDLEKTYLTTPEYKRIDQLANLIQGLKKDPNGRRHILSAWNVGDLEHMALPPCHIMSQYYVSKGRLSCHMYQRSVDVFLGLPFNIASYALLTHMIAQVCNLDVGELIISTGDTHIYRNHIEQVKEQLSRKPYPLPTLCLNPKIKSIDDFVMDDIRLIGYQSHGTIKGEMAV